MGVKKMDKITNQPRSFILLAVLQLYSVKYIPDYNVIILYEAKLKFIIKNDSRKTIGLQ